MNTHELRESERPLTERLKGPAVDPQVKPDFPVCQTGKRIPWSVAERAYEGYVKRYGKCQTLERIAERGGFYVEELDQLYPAWREEVEEVYLLRKEVSLLRQQLAGEKEAYQLSDRIATGRMHKAEAKVQLVKDMVANEVPGTVVWTDHAGFDAHQYAVGGCAAAFRAGETAGRVKFAREIEAALTGVQRKITV